MPEEPRWGPATTYRSSPSLRRGASKAPGRPGATAPAPPRQGRATAREDGTYGPAARSRDAAGRPAARPGGRSGGAPPRRPAGASPVRPGISPTRRRGLTRLVVLLVVLAVVVYPVALGVVAYRAVHRTGALPSSELSATPGQTVLLVGSDSREDLTRDQKVQLSTGDADGQRTDTIMLLHRPSSGGPTVLLSIPRDSYVEVPGHGSNKINAAYSIGGPDLLVQTVEGATGIRVDDYVETGLGGFAGLVDAVGGVTMCPAEAIQDPKAGLDVQAGCQTMDGATALGYARTRDFDPNGDLGRAQRQREIIGAVAKEAASPSTLLNPFKAFPLAAAGGGALTADDGFGPVAMLGFVRGVRAVAGGDAVSLNVPVADTTRRTKAGLVVDWDDEQAEAVFDAIKDDDTEAIRAIAAAEPTGAASSSDG